eukprot:199799-Lingulodinium_polyedra.AAC.1
MHAIPKKVPGTHRLIGVMPSLWRLLMRILCLEEVRPWDTAVAAEDDTAAPGRAIERAVFKRLLEQECSTARGDFSLAALWDLDSFYDTVLLDVMVREAKAWAFPL